MVKGHHPPLYGLEQFRFLVFEFISLEESSNTAHVLKAILLAAEQRYLDSFNPRYNICDTAGSSLGSSCIQMGPKRRSSEEEQTGGE